MNRRELARDSTEDIIEQIKAKSNVVYDETPIQFGDEIITRPKPIPFINGKPVK